MAVVVKGLVKAFTLPSLLLPHTLANSYAHFGPPSFKPCSVLLNEPHYKFWRKQRTRRKLARLPFVLLLQCVVRECVRVTVGMYGVYMGRHELLESMSTFTDFPLLSTKLI